MTENYQLQKLQNIHLMLKKAKLRIKSWGCKNSYRSRLNLGMEKVSGYLLNPCYAGNETLCSDDLGCTILDFADIFLILANSRYRYVSFYKQIIFNFG